MESLIHLQQESRDCASRNKPINVCSRALQGIWHGKSKPNYSRASELLNNNDEVKEDTRCDKSGKGQKHIATDV
ncbi:hypothetical protein P8452_43055 [Trifolium repens]|nr:hypothetical protein P8452_43055 [Trifolium repens]